MNPNLLFIMDNKMELNLESLEQMISDDINPALAMHSGFVQVVALEENRVILSFHAGCSKCPSSRGSTLFQIQSYLREHFGIADLIVENAEFAE